jgi:glycosyltransferase involved in cell wall biosynthesis/SAM-dependent methyltransferase
MIKFTGERIVPGADNCENNFADKMYQEHLARYAFAVQWAKGKRVLDVGCGVGYGSHWLAENGAETVLAFDISPDTIEHAREFYSHPNVIYKVASATDFDFGKRFDVITCFELIEHVDDQRAVIQCIRQALSDEGVLIISTPRALEAKRTHFHTHEFSELEFRELLKETFPQLHMYFENNHFSSLITDKKPNQIERVLPLYDQFSLAQADYLIAVASPSSRMAITNGMLPVMVMGNDKYVTLLERDVDILHKAESRLIEERDSQIATFNHTFDEHEKAFSQQLQELQQAHEQQKGEQARQHAEREQAHLDQLTQARRQLETQLRELSEREKAFSQQLQELQQAHEQQKGEQARQHAEREQAFYAQLQAKQDELQGLTQRWVKAEIVHAKVLTQLHRELDGIRATYSWRWTAPLRNLSTLFGKNESDHPKRLVIDAADDSANNQFTEPPIQTTELSLSVLQIHSDNNTRLIDMPLSHTNPVAGTLEELLSYHDEHFVRCAYHTILGRAPDIEGSRYYLARVRAGISKIEILSQLRLSEEGKNSQVEIDGLNEVIKRHRQLKTPVLGNILRLFIDKHSNGGTQQYLRAIENKLHVSGEEVQRRLSEINQSMAKLQELVMRCELNTPAEVTCNITEPKKSEFCPQDKEHELASFAQSVPIKHSVGNQSDDNASHTFDVIFAIGCWEGESKRYRVHNIAEGLLRMGYKVDVMPFEHIGTLVDKNIKAHTVVLFRAPFDVVSRVELFIKYAKLNGIKVVFDVDDLVFEPDVIDQIDGFRLLPAEEKDNYVAGVYAYRKLLLASDMVTVPTEYLRKQALAIGHPTFVIPNSINDAQLTIAHQLALEEKVEGGPIRIGYFSGSRTHQADFAECADALFDLMKSHKDIKLRIVGYLDLDSRWDDLTSRIERLDFQPYQTMLRVLNECDINIAPLQLSSVFCHGKSELKFFEAGLLGIPTVASATDTYARVIDNGINGFSVTTKKEWMDALNALVASSTLRKSIGEKAKEASIALYGISHIAKQAAQVYGLRKLKPIDSQITLPPAPTPRRLRITWVIPELIIGGGGHRNILRAAYFLSQFGHDISLYFTGTNEDPQSIKRKIQEHFYPLDCPVHLFSGRVDPADVVFATHWSTVSAALTARDTAIEIMYFVQDFEPAFAPMSSEYVLAENTYRLGLYHITSGPWCEVVLRRDFNAEADHFRFPVDRAIYYPRTRTKRNTNLIFFAKPEMPRRCFELGVMALREFHKLRPEVEIIMFGSKNARTHSYDFPVTIRDVLPTLDDLAEMYSNGDIGLVFSTTNPSLIPYEMMACGLPVVDLARGDNAVNYGGRSDIALLADPLPEKMAIQIARLLDDSAECSQRRVNGIEFIEQFPSEEEMARRVDGLIIGRLNKSLGIEND